MAFKEAVREQSFARIAIEGPAGSGKTYSSLVFAAGLAPEGKILLIDTENYSSSILAGRDSIPKFFVDSITEPYTVQSYLDKIDEALKEKPDVLIIDSISHAWASVGGILEQVDRIRSGGSSSAMAWREMTPKHNKFVLKLLTMPCHLICTLRTVTQTVLEQDPKSGKYVPRKVGMKPIQREGVDYEFTQVFDLNRESHSAIVSKDRTPLVGEEMLGALSRRHGEMLRDFLLSGAPMKENPPISQDSAPQESNVKPITQGAISRLDALASQAGTSLTAAMADAGFGGELDNLSMEDALKIADYIKGLTKTEKKVSNKKG